MAALFSAPSSSRFYSSRSICIDACSISKSFILSGDFCPPPPWTIPSTESYASEGNGDKSPEIVSLTASSSLLNSLTATWTSSCISSRKSNLSFLERKSAKRTCTKPVMRLLSSTMGNLSAMGGSPLFLKFS